MASCFILMVSTLDKSRPDSSYLIQQQGRAQHLSPQVLQEARSLQVQQERWSPSEPPSASQPPQASQLDLLALLEKFQEPAIRIEGVPAELTVGEELRFWLIHQESGLRVPGQFSRVEAEFILKATSEWDWEIRHRPRTPCCGNRLLNLLKTVCKPQTQEVAA